MIRLVARENAVGLGRDVRILAGALARHGAEPLVSHARSVSPLHLLRPRRPDETLVFLERVGVRWLRAAARTLLVPNPEWYPPRRVPLLRGVDHVLAKTRHGVEVFSRLHPSVHHLGFTSDDRRLPGAAPDHGRILHLAGGSRLKGTAAVLEAWRRHPEWPPLTLVRHARPGEPPLAVPPNVELVTRYLPDAELRALQNACGVHLCPSLSEGWGHYIAEAASCGAVVVTTDAPPMNELVEEERGVLVPWARSEPRKLGTNYHVAAEALEAAVDGLLARPAEEQARMGAAARAWFEENDRRFHARVGELLGELLPGALTSAAPARSR